MKSQKGFTLIELLVVIAIIGLLSSVVLASLNSARTKAKITKAKMEMKQVVTAIIIAQGESGTYLRNITGTYNNSMTCSVGSDLRDISDTSTCYLWWAGALNNINTPKGFVGGIKGGALAKIQAATNGLVLGLDKITRDPWGSPYMLDENEGEGGTCNAMNMDTLVSPGPNGIYSYGGDDDIIFYIPISGNSCPNNMS